MSDARPGELDRRALLTRSTVAAAAGLGAVVAGSAAGAGPAWAAGPLAPTGGARLQADDPQLPGPNPPIPDVPGMKGDARANEFWYRLDQYSYFNPPASWQALFKAVGEKVGPVPSWRKLWLEHVQRDDYRSSYAALWAPARAELAEMSRIQKLFFDAYYRRYPSKLLVCFAQMAQGELYDPRLPDGYKLHTMDPPSGGTEAYHRWHVIIRAQVFLGIDAAWWSAIDRLVGYAWAAQSVAQPVKDSPDNPGLPKDVDAGLKRSWLPRTSEQLDAAFVSFPYPSDLPGAR
ncbi:hypothetical protein [Spirillospora sp. NPDC047279]|uniref:hypothetical protein n=1 Tax=Spirillospora sp. NPDC047279 TaxID=3155478 RepID=UPI0033F76A2A